MLTKQLKRHSETEANHKYSQTCVRGTGYSLSQSGTLKECQKLINISDLGVCRGAGRLCPASALFTLSGKQVQLRVGEFFFGSKIAFRILFLLEACSERNSHVIIHHGD